MEGHFRITDDDVEKIAKAVMSRIEERLMIDELATAIMQKTATELERIKASITNNPFHNPSSDQIQASITLDEQEMVALQQGKIAQAKVLEFLKSDSLQQNQSGCAEDEKSVAPSTAVRQKKSKVYKVNKERRSKK